MKRVVQLCLFVLAAYACTGYQPDQQLEMVDRNATKETRALYANMVEMQGRSVMFGHQDETPDIEQNAIFKFLRRRFNITRELHGRNFTVKQPHPKTGKMVTWLTPLAVALIMVETVDLIFAVDSVPAVFAVTQDTFIVYTSNIFAVLGLRALYFALAAAMNRFRYLQVSLAIILVLIGIKIFLVPLGVHINTLLSLVVTLTILASGVLYSLYKTRNEPDMSVENLAKQQHTES